MKEIISDVDLRALLIRDEPILSNTNFSDWSGMDQFDLAWEIYDSLDQATKYELRDEASGEMFTYLKTILEDQIDRVMHLIRQIRDEEHRN